MATAIKKNRLALRSKATNGFTLIEIVVAMMIFVLLIGSLFSIFVQALQGQKKTLATQEVLDQTSYVMDYMGRAIRMAKKDTSGSCIGANLNYIATNSRILDGQTFQGPGIKFLNYEGVCQEFFRDDGDFKIKESKNAASPVDLTSANMNINNLNIIISGETQNDAVQPEVTLFLGIEGKDQSKIKIQTTISQRNLDIQR